MSHTLTAPQRKAMEQAAAHKLGLIATPLGGGFQRTSFLKMMERLCAAGLMRPNAHGEHEITDAGREALR